MVYYPNICINKIKLIVFTHRPSGQVSHPTVQEGGAAERGGYIGDDTSIKHRQLCACSGRGEGGCEGSFRGLFGRF